MNPAAPKAPSMREALRELDRAEKCLRAASSEWRDMPTRIRVRLVRCADRAEALLRRAGCRP